MTSELYPKVGFNEIGGVIAFAVAALAIVIATRGRLGYSGSPAGKAAQSGAPVPTVGS